MRRTLTLRKHTLTELTAGDLASIAGGETELCTITLVQVQCLTTVVGPTVTTVIGEFTFQCTGNC